MDLFALKLDQKTTESSKIQSAASQEKEPRILIDLRDRECETTYQKSQPGTNMGAKSKDKPSDEKKSVLIIFDSHGKSIDPKKLYRNQEINKVVLPEGRKNYMVLKNILKKIMQDGLIQ